MSNINGRNVLVIGNGGREHAICWKLSHSPRVTQVFCLPGSPGIGKMSKVTCVTDVKANDFKGIVNWCKEKQIYIVVVGPEDPLANGLADLLTASSIHCFGPCKQGAQIEADKDWSKKFMTKHGIPTAEFRSFTDASEAKAFIRTAPFEALVVKAAGLAAGKGVIVADTRDEACEAVDKILGEKAFGEAGNVVVIEEKLTGEEVSVLAFIDENTVKVMLPAQDHKRIGDCDTGANTGGMGAYCPCPLITKAELELVEREVLRRALEGLKKENIKYNGVLYAGMMLTPKGPKTLEFNCRFGDPETQVILPLMKNDFFEVVEATCLNKLANVNLRFRENVFAVGVVMASKGYPETSTKGSVIQGLNNMETLDQITFHSGVSRNVEGKFVTNGGRVLINVNIAGSLKRAADEATDRCRQIKFLGAQFRTDIGRKAYSKMSLSYKDSGVDIEAGDKLVQNIKPLVKNTNRAGVIGSIGSFGGMFRLNELKREIKKGSWEAYKDPVLVQGTDGVGTKLKLAQELNLWDTVGIDLVAMCANDVVCLGADPFAFLDYIACGNLDVPIATTIVKGIADACRDVGASLLGGETAEMPSMYEKGKYDLAGYCVGIVEHDQVLPKMDQIREGDLLIGLPSNGLHSNGFSLIHKLIRTNRINLNDTAAFSSKSLTYGQEFLIPTRLYVRDVLPLMQQGHIKAAANITGGGLPFNVVRVLPVGLAGYLDALTFDIPPVFGWVASIGNVSDVEMQRTFNCGVGMVLVVEKGNTAWEVLKKKGAKQIGTVEKRGAGPPVVISNFNTAINKVIALFGTTTNVAISYKDSGVDIEAGDEVVQRIKQFAQSTDRAGVEGNLGSFGGKFRLNDYLRDKQIADPVLVMGTDGVGTKLKLAQELNRHDTIGIDLVAMCVNDILCNGAEPLTFLDYYACGHIDVNNVVEVVKGISDGCLDGKCALIGGETAEMPGMYDNKVYDIAGFALGVADYKNLLPKPVAAGDVLVALPSSGVHSNGFSLVHKVLQSHGAKLEDPSPFGGTFGAELLTPTRIYVDAVLPVLKYVKALAHITGGGLTENIPRVLTKDLGVVIDARKFEILPIFAWLSSQGNIEDNEMLKTFNCGIGMVLVVAADKVTRVLSILGDQQADVIGKVVPVNIIPKQVTVEHFSECIQRVQKTLSSPKKKLAVLISGNGSNLQAIIDATKQKNIGAEIVLVISNKPDAFGLQRAKNANIPTAVIKHKDYASREDFDEAMSKELKKHGVDFVLLAGFMRIVTQAFVKEWKGRLVNIHPSLLPKYGGLHAQKQALEAKDTVSGCTIHFVDEGVDTGAIILQKIVPIVEGDTEETLQARIHKAEHITFPRAVRLLACGAVSLGNDGHVQWH